MIYGNHNKKRGDIVKIARWDGDTIVRAALNYGVKPEEAEEIEFVVWKVLYFERYVVLVPLYSNRLTNMHFVVNLDETNLIRVSRMAEERV